MEKSESQYQIRKKRKNCPHNDINFTGYIFFERNYCRSNSNKEYSGSSEFGEEININVKCTECGMTLKGKKGTDFIDNLKLREELI